MILQRDHFDLVDKTIIERVIFQPPFKAHTPLQEEACFLHVIRGKSRLYVPTQQVDLKATDNLVMKCGSYLNHWFKTEDEKPNEAILIHIYPEVLKLIYDDELPDFFASTTKKPTAPIEKLKINEMISNYIESLVFYFENPSLVTDELIKLKVKELILLLVHSQFSENLSAIFSNLFEPEKFELKEFIESHLFEDLSLNDLASIAGMSLATFKRRFTSVFEESPKRYINNKRLEKAKGMLTQTSLRISDIAYDCGFNDVGYFSKMFHQKYNTTPTNYRKAS